MPYKTPNKTSLYIRNLMKDETDKDLSALLTYADAHNVPIILPEAALFLLQLLQLKKPAKILEIGTAIGYSGILMLKNSNAHLCTIEKDKSMSDIARRNFKNAGLDDRVTLCEGDADEVLPALTGKFELIFMDGPKSRYLKYLGYVKDMMNSDSVLLCDNVLFNGMVAGEVPPDKSKGTIIRNLDSFLRAIMDDKELLTSILNVGDGLSLSIKK